MGKQRNRAMNEKRPERFFEIYPKMRQWVVECVSCHHLGLRLDVPTPKTTHLVLHKLINRFEPLELDKNGLCEQCRTAL